MATEQPQAGFLRRLDAGAEPVLASLNGTGPVVADVLIKVIELGNLHPTVCSELKWQVFALGHGATVADFPPFARGPLGRQPRWAVPARGVAASIACRSLVVAVSYTGAGPVGPVVSLSMLARPSGASAQRPFPSADGNEVRQFFPAQANEWRLATSGIEFEETQPVGLYGFSDDVSPFLVATCMAGALVEWSAVPLFAHSWGALSGDPAIYHTGAISAVYR